ncbi:ankyrin repeat and LEM domain-containing protein 2 isoform X2 [Latimeria chalumnae]|uniref:ankyrin repeat and LEM domain-containing protein 2 isoform X2 n=1 Tax=Latimeria chalumnae TaxID=7897 RepID=UPI0003C18120|nr:PREDICTED: ankyrin repeat and LEM domain-containing protein 2 isoform X2 [Latimeria chalumnae]|eukprot:XP_005990286.1 PREDICTED: ankyrin repeat and LEM domain-containing protein 2 isoform X2 [Latimeria chalumnae]
MDTILNRLKQLTPDDLRAEIISAGLKCGPITPTTRFIFEKKLAKALLEREEEGASETNPPAESPNAQSEHATQNDCQAAASCSPHSDAAGQPSQSCEEGDFGYGVGLNPPEEEAIPVKRDAVSDSAVDHTLQDHAQAPKESSTSSTLYYGVCPVWDDILARNDRVHVYVDKKEALQAVKNMKGSRFKAFTNRDDAEKFAKGICDYYPSPNKSSLCKSPVRAGLVFLKEAETINRERANSFKSPRTQDLTAKLRKNVEKGDEAGFSELIWSNPRYLIGSGDNPTVVHEGCRYNVMHVASKENQPGICQLLLDSLENPDFMRLMYPDDTEVMLQNRITYIVDLYLNTPDKLGFESPLHFACKFGNAEVVNVLCSHPDTVKDLKNKYDQTAADVICERSKNKSEELKEKIREYLQDRYYVPLLRAEDNSSPPVISVPWSPDPSESTSCVSFQKHTASPKDPILTVRAFAGPMSPSKAEEFHKVWKTPPRERAVLFHRVKKSDPDKGIERVGRELAHEMGHPWTEYWEFLGTFADFCSHEGLRKLEEYLSRKALSERTQLEAGENETLNKFKVLSPPSKTNKCCNSISVGAFLDEDDDDMRREEIKNRQNAALKNSQAAVKMMIDIGATGESQCHILPLEGRSDIIIMENGAGKQLMKETSSNKNGFCSAIETEKVECRERRPLRGWEKGLLSPVSNLMVEFEKLSLRDREDTQEIFAEELSEAAGKEKVRNEDALVAELNQLSLLESQGCKSAEERDIEGDGCGRTGAAGQTPEVSNLRTGHAVVSEVEALAHIQSPEKPDSQGRPSECAYYTSPELSQECFIMKTPPRRGKGLFVLGDEPSKVDCDVLAAVGELPVDPQKYPNIEKWKTAVLSYSTSDRQSWSSPAILKGKVKTQPGSPGCIAYSTSGRYSPGKYGNSSFSSDFGSPSRYSPAYASHIQLLKLRQLSDPSAL